MGRLARHRPSPSMIVSMVALFVALSGVSYAALAVNSVGSKQLKKNSVTTAKIKKNAVTGAKVKDGSLLSGDFAAGQLPAGAKGATGATGPEGPSGTATAFARVAANGTLLPLVPEGNPSFPAETKGLTAGNITHTAATGVYCFVGLSFNPASALVSLDNAGASGAAENNFVASVAVERGAGLGGCPAGTNARVVTTQWSDTVAPANTDHGFIIWFEK